MVSLGGKYWRWFLMGWLLAILISFVIAASASISATRFFNSESIEIFKQRLGIARNSVRVLRVLTILPNSDFLFWGTALDLLEQVHDFKTNLANIPKDIFSSTLDVQKIDNQIDGIANSLNKMVGDIDKSILVKWLIRPDYFKILAGLVDDVKVVFNLLTINDQNYIFILQNSDELRPTGGFMGSYAMLSLKNGNLSDLKFADIYEPDGQFKGFVEPPAGISEYLSSGNGLRLPDANWSPDFPTSARQILYYFSLGNKQQIDGLVAINVSLVEKLLDIFGPIYLVDYDVNVDSQNLASVARMDRDKFFPGSQQKVNILSSLFVPLKLKILSATTEQQKQLLQLLMSSLATKDIQAFFNEPKLQEILDKNGLANRLSSKKSSESTQATSEINFLPFLESKHWRDVFKDQPTWRTPFLLGIVEANVGINKINRVVNRDVDFIVNDKQAVLKINYRNDNIKTSDKKNGYINYLRLFLLPEVNIDKAKINGVAVESWHDDQITTIGGETFRQIGFIVTVPEQENRTVEISLELDHPADTWDALILPKQSGVKQIKYQINWQGLKKEFLLERDTELPL